MLEHLGDGLPLRVVGLSVGLVPKGCLGHKFRLEGTTVAGWVGVLTSLDPGDPVTLGVGTDVVSSSRVILGMLASSGCGLYPLLYTKNKYMKKMQK